MKTVAIVIGRLNPPTTGHLKLLEALDAQPADDKFLFLSHSSDHGKNPLSYEQKLYFVRRLFEDRFPEITIQDTSYKTLIEVVQSLTGYDELILVAGGDRVDAFQTLLDKYNGNPDKAGNILYSFDSIQVVSAGSRDPDAEDVSGMSASKLRSFAANDDFENFEMGVPTNDAKLAKELFLAVRKGMKLIERLMREADPKAAAASSAKDATADTAKKAAAELKKLKDKRQAEEDKQGNDAMNGFLARAKSLAADGGLSKSAEDFSKARAQVLVLLSDPVTKYHAAAIDQFINAPARVAKGFPARVPAYRFVVIASSKNDIVENAGVRALWVSDLVGSTKKARIMFGKVEAITRALASRFGYMEFSGQQRVLNKTSSLMIAEWNRVKAGGADTQTVFKRELSFLGVTSPTFDDPNSAQEALATTDKELITDISAFKKKVEDGSSIATELEREIAAIADKRKKAFIEELPRGKNLAYLEAIYYAFCAFYKKKTGKSLWDLFKSVFASEIEAVSNLGQEIGVTQGVQAISKVKSFLTDNEPAPTNAGATSTQARGA